MNSVLVEMLNDSNEMPALGVALHDETINALKKGVWLEVCFSKIIHHNEMPFDSLLIEVCEDFSGFNIIRKNNGVYGGRCFYIALKNKTMKNLKTLI